MNDNEYIAISTFSKITNVSVQSIYERINKKDNAIHKYIKADSKPLQIHISAVKDLYNKDYSSTLTSTLKGGDIMSEKKPSGTPESGPSSLKFFAPTETPKVQDEDNAYLKLIAVLEKQVEQQKKDLETKDKQIAEISERLKDSQNLLSQQQQLALADKQNNVLMLGEKTQKQKKWYEFWKEI